MTEGGDFIKRGKCKNNHCSSMSDLPWSDLNKDCSICDRNKSQIFT